ncbi:MAG: PepSY domain-containing protein [Pseudomonadota bacterium]|nr:PepSY domain-containing protein [Pseudomonadota bacterium]
MPVTTKHKLRGTWFSVHKWIGILLAVLVIPVSLSGSALVWHDWLDETANPARYAVSDSATRLAPSAYVTAARAAMQPGERIAQMRYPEHKGAIVITLQSAQPGERTNLWIDPADGRLLDRASSNDGLVRVLHRLHGSLMVPGVGRQIVGWIGVAMLVSALTGLWLWWPLKGRWTQGLRWRRQPTVNANLHHQAGFWIAIPLAMLAFTGVWISFPPLFAAVAGLPPPPPRSAPAQPLTAPGMAPDAALAAASVHATGPLVSIAWPTDKKAEWKLGFAREGGNAEVVVDDATRAAIPPGPVKPETLARTMRRLHDGTGMGAIWQVVIFVGGILPALLAVTGLIMWLRTRGRRGDAVRRRKQRSRIPAPAE